MYPTTVVVLVESQRSMTDVCGISPSNATRVVARVASEHEARAATLGHLSFAAGPNPSLTDGESIATLPLQSRYSNGHEHDVDIAEKTSDPA